MTMQVSTDLYLYHISRPLLMRFLGPPPIKECHFSFYFCILTHSCLPHSPHLTQTFGPLSTKQFTFLVCIWHITSPGLALTSHVVKSVHRNTHARSPDLCSRATSICVPLSHQVTRLCHDLSHACIGMFESLLLRPYCADDLWTSIQHPDMGHRSCHCSCLAAIEFR